ncbi:uncharacterized protein [Nicotiana tomentosiformis]|uniref:uncharacterized protein n=1 Tax=Nicotiana tomentosiformis TaxID=4098 RepID=UPI00388C83E9
MAPYEALYGRICRSPVGWFELGEAKLLGTNLVRDALEKIKLIQDRLCTTQSRQMSYVNWRAREVVFMAGERVLLRVSPMRGVMRFEKKGKLSPRYIGSFEILQRKYYGDPSHVLDFNSVKLDTDLTYIEDLVAILDRQVRKLRSKNITSMMVQWRGHPVNEATWVTENNMQSLSSPIHHFRVDWFCSGNISG